MNTVEHYHDITRTYRGKLREIWDNYQKGYKLIEGYKGSNRYKKELAKLQEKRDEAIKAAQDNARGRYVVVLREMKKGVEKHPAKAPTPEQMNMVNALKMREKVESDELVRAAEQMRGVDLAVHVLDEIATANGYHGLLDDYMGDTARAEKAVKALGSSAELTLTLTRPDGAEARRKSRHIYKWGGEWDERHEGIELHGTSNRPALSHVDRDFKDARETVCELGGVEGHYQSFCNIVNS